MRTYSLLALFLIMPCGLQAAWPLESIAVEGTGVPQPVIVELSGLSTGKSVDDSDFQAACQKLQATGLFSVIRYRFSPAGKGVALNLELEDAPSKLDLVFDLPGVDQIELTRWLNSRYPQLRGRTPDNPDSHAFFQEEIRRLFAKELNGAELTTKLESDLARGKMVVAVQLAHPPVIEGYEFSGNHHVATARLAELLDKVAHGQPYVERYFRQYLTLNLTPEYENNGYYRVRYPSVTTVRKGDPVTVSVGIEEGNAYRLADASFQGGPVESAQLLAAAKLPVGQLANWGLIVKGLQEAERIVRRKGYFAVKIVPERKFDDAAKTLSVTGVVKPGPLYRFGELKLIGLSPETEAAVRKQWKVAAGDPYDYEYPTEFLGSLRDRVAFARHTIFGITPPQPTAGHVVDIEIEFKMRP